MYPDHRSHEARVPMTCYHTMITWCSQCRAWRLSTWVATFQSDQTLELHHDAVVDFGPFDGPEVVLEELVKDAQEALRSPAAPWYER